MASLMADILSTKTRGIIVAVGSKEETAGINYVNDTFIHKKILVYGIHIYALSAH